MFGIGSYWVWNVRHCASERARVKELQTEGTGQTKETGQTKLIHCAKPPGLPPHSG